MGDVKKARRKKMFSPKSVTKLEDLTVFISLHVKGNEYFLRTKSQKCKKPLNILKKKGFYKQILDFHSPFKIFATHRNYEILSKSLVPNGHLSYFR
jgi:hypothetical protein